MQQFEERNLHWSLPYLKDSGMGKIPIPKLPREAWEAGRERSDRETEAQADHTTRHREREGI